MNLKLMKKICSLNISKLGKYLLKYLYSKDYKKVEIQPNYILARGEIPICLIAHLDTVFKKLPVDFDEYIYDNTKKILWYPGGAGFDDRAGIYAIIQILEKGFKPHIIFTNGEESGGIGSNDLIKKYKKSPFQDCKLLIQLDRANEKDMVFYNCDNIDLINYIEKFGFIEDWGTFTDISILAPVWEIGAVNLSIGYLDEHTEKERLNCNWCDNTIQKVINILKSYKKMPFFKYIPFKYSYKHELINEQDLLTPSCFLCNDKKSQLFKIEEGIHSYYLCEKCYNKYFFYQDKELY